MEHSIARVISCHQEAQLYSCGSQLVSILEGLRRASTASVYPQRSFYRVHEVALPSDLHYLPSSVQYCASPVRKFLTWASLRHASVDSITLDDIDAFTVRAEGARLERTDDRWCLLGSANFLSLRRTPRVDECWFRRKNSERDACAATETRECSVVANGRRVIAALNDENPSACRAKAVLLLAAVYGLRCAEIVRLTLEDLDWYNEVLTVSRAKRGRIQQFPDSVRGR